MKKSGMLLSIQLIICCHIFMSTALFAYQPAVGVLRFTPQGATQSDADAVRELVVGELVKSGKLNVLDRDKTKLILSEQAFQQSGATDFENAVKIGRIINARYVVYGSLMRLGEDYVVTVNMVDVETGEVLNSSEKQFKNIAGARDAVKAAVFGIATMKRKTGEKWSAAKTATFVTGTAIGIGALTTGIISYSKYNTANGIDIDIHSLSDSNEIERQQNLSAQTRSSSEILATVAIISAVTSVAFHVWSHFLHKDPVYEDITIQETSQKKNEQPDVSVKNAGSEVTVPPVQTEIVNERRSEDTSIIIIDITKSQSDNSSSRDLEKFGLGDGQKTNENKEKSVEISGSDNAASIEMINIDTCTGCNRSGLRLQVGMLWGNPMFFLNKARITPVTKNSFGAGYVDTAEFRSGPLMRFNLAYQIKIGQHCYIEVGPVGQWQSMNVEYLSSNGPNSTKLDFTNGLVGVTNGLFYVNRIYPWKVNAGIFADAGFAWFTSSLDSLDATGKPLYTTSIFGSSYQSTNWANAFGWGVGMRAGGEYLFTRHFGASVDFMCRFSRSEYTPNKSFWGSDPEDTHIKYLLGFPTDNNDHPLIEIVPPIFGFSVELTRYF